MKQVAARPADRSSPRERTSERLEQRLARRGGGLELLRVPAALFGAVARVRSALYDRRLLPIAELEVAVVSVGNLTAGGTGKTPMAAWIARAFERRGWRPGILSRGYGRARDAGSRDEASALALNDEGEELARTLPDVPHVQDANRVRGGQALVDRGVDAIVLDDGFQHRRLHRDVDVVLVDATRPWGLAAPPGGGEPVRAFLPRGLLREPPAALARADAIVITRSDAVAGTELARLEGLVEELAPGRPIALARHAPVALRVQGADVGLASLAGREVDLVSGIGNPEAFEATVSGLGATVREHRAFPDHHPYSKGDLAGLSRPLVTTAKDAVKLEGFAGELHVLDVELAVTSGESVLHALLEALPESRRLVERRAFHEGLHG